MATDFRLTPPPHVSENIPARLVPERLRRTLGVLRGVDSGALHSNHLFWFTRDLIERFGARHHKVLFNHVLERAHILGHELIEPLDPIPVD